MKNLPSAGYSVSPNRLLFAPDHAEQFWLVLNQTRGPLPRLATFAGTYFRSYGFNPGFFTGLDIVPALPSVVSATSRE